MMPRDTQTDPSANTASPATVVIDVGAMPHPPEESTYFLADRFDPWLLLAYDGGPWFDEGVEEYKRTVIQRYRLAAWTSNGKQQYHNEGMRSGITLGGDLSVQTFDLAEMIINLRDAHRLIVKLDCEGAEYVLCPHLHSTGADKLIDLLLVEWHPPHLANGWYVPVEERAPLRCEVADWNDLTGLETEAEATP